MSNTEQSGEAGLVRGIKRWDLAALVVNSVIGAGIFGLPATAYEKAGPYSLLAFVVCAVLVVLVVLCFTEVTSRFTQTGGPYLYAHEVFNPWVAFQVGWLLWLTRMTGFAAVCNLLLDNLAVFWPDGAKGMWRPAIITAIVILYTVINIIGVRASAIVSNVFTIGKLLPLAMFVAVGLFFVDSQRYSLDVPFEYRNFTTAVLLLVYAFTGFEIPVIAAGEVSDPRRDFPVALLTGMAVVVTLYISIQFICIGTLPGLGESRRPLADAARHVLGSPGASFLVMGALISTSGALGAIMLAGSRVPFAMAEQRQLPQWLSRTHPRFATPYVSILVSSALILGFTLAWSFLSAVTISTIARLITYASTCIALIVLRRRSDRPAAFSIPGGIFVSLLSLAAIVWLLSNVDFEKEGLNVGIAMVVGLVLCAICRLWSRTRT